MRSRHVLIFIILFTSLFPSFSCKKKTIEAEFRMIAYEKQMRYGAGVLTGTLQNIGNGDAERVGIYMEAKNSSNQLLCSGLIAVGSLLRPGEKGNFEVWFSLIKDWGNVAKIDYQITWFDIGQDETEEFWGAIIF